MKRAFSYLQRSSCWLERFLEVKENSLRAFDPQEAILNTIRYCSVRSRPYVADLATIQFLKARIIPEHQMHCVTFLDTAGKRWNVNYFLNLFPVDGSWYVKTAKNLHAGIQPPAKRTRPWLYTLGGELTAYAVFTGGEVRDDRDAEIASVQLTSPNGWGLTDTVQDGLALFWSDQVMELPIYAELYNRSGEVVNRHTVLTPPLPLMRFGGTFRPTP